MTAPSDVFSGTNVFKAGEFKSSVVKADLRAFWDGGGSAVAANKKFYLYLPVAFKIDGWAVFCDTSATLTIDIWSVLIANAPPTVTNTICNSNYIAITAGTQNQLIAGTASALGFASSLNVNGIPILPAGSAVIFNLKTNDNATFIGAQLIGRSGS